MRTPLFVLACALASSVALATPPPSPTLTVGAADIKQLHFDIEPVPRVNWYELWFKPNNAAQWVKFTQVPAQRNWIRINVAVHLLDWPQARYHVKACNPSGCGTSNEVGVNDEKLAAIGYLKPVAPTGVLHYGGHVAVSADGKTIAVVSGETLGTKTMSGVVHVYRKTTSTSGWRRQTRLIPSTVQSATGQYYLGDQVAISGDGNLIAFGAWPESSPNSPEGSGAVYLFRYDGVAWREAQKIPGARTLYGNYFGYIVKLDDAGRTLAVSHTEHAGEYKPGTVEIYQDLADFSDQFVHQSTLTVPANPDPEGNSSCEGFALSGDGQTIMRGCYVYPDYNFFSQVMTAPGWSEVARLPGHTVDGYDLSYDGTQALIQNGNYGEAYRLGPGGWVHDGSLTDFGGYPDGQRRHIALSRDGKIAAIGNWSDIAAGLGPIFPPYQTADRESGGVVIHERRSTGWILRRAIKPGSTNQQNFGHVVALGDNGRILVVGAPLDASNATGIDGDRDDDSAPNRGAVWIY
jgi:hypothetical protein